MCNECVLLRFHMMLCGEEDGPIILFYLLLHNQHTSHLDKSKLCYV